MTAVAHRALTRFRCLQDRCEDTCCAGLTIPVDAKAEERLVREGLSDGLLRYGQPALLAMRPEGGCHFLEGGRCSVQLRFGESALPSACATFPRRVRTSDERTEVTGSLACPEMVRLALCDDDGLEWEPFDLAQLPRRVDETVRPAASVPGLEALLRASYPLASRLAMMAQLAFVLERESDSAELSELQCAAIDHNFTSLALPLDGANASLDSLLAQVVEGKRSNSGTARFVGWAEERLTSPEAKLSLAEWDRLDVLLTRRARYGLEQLEPESTPLRSVGQLVLRLALIRRFAVRAEDGSIDERFTKATQLLAKHVESGGPISALERALFDVEPQRTVFSCWLFAKTLAR